jgi:hypothetical protein
MACVVNEINMALWVQQLMGSGHLCYQTFETGLKEGLSYSMMH